MKDVEYIYVPQSNQYMTFARDIARACYKVWGWDKKTQPVAVIVQKEEIVSWAIAADGMHALNRVCDREMDKGSDYDACEWCRPAMHAEALAVSRAGTSLGGATCYVWGHYKMCDHCVLLLNKAGIKSLVLMKDSEILFNRHRAGSLVGRPEKFLIQ